MLIQLIQFTAIVGAIALAPKLVTIELTHEGDDLWQWLKDNAPRALVKGRTLCQNAADRWQQLSRRDPDHALADRAADAATTDFDADTYHVGKIAIPLLTDIEIADRNADNDAVRPLGETQQQRIARLDRIAAVRSDAEATAQRMRDQVPG
jgi:hypothetical protein